MKDLFPLFTLYFLLHARCIYVEVRMEYLSVNTSPYHDSETSVFISKKPVVLTCSFLDITFKVRCILAVIKILLCCTCSDPVPYRTKM